MNMWLLIIAIVCLVLIPFAPHLLRLRVRILRWLRWHWAADMIEGHFQGWVLFARILLLVIVAVLVYIGWT